MNDARNTVVLDHACDGRDAARGLRHAAERRRLALDAITVIAAIAVVTVRTIVRLTGLTGLTRFARCAVPVTVY